MRKSRFAGIATLLCVALALPVFPATAEDNGQVHRGARSETAPPVARIIIGLRAEADAEALRVQATGSDHVRALSQRTGLRFRSERDIGPTMRIVELESPLSGTALESTLALLESDPSVAFAEPDGRVYRHAVPVDPLFANQWYLQNQQASALDAVTAWDVTTGSSSRVVAVLDTGVRFEHPDLLPAGSGRLLPGYDFVGPESGGGFRVANDGDGWDANAEDPGDWISAADRQSSLFSDCFEEDSSWHGTRVAGLIGAIANNGQGVSGITWGPLILPVRVLGKCFGNNSDILQAMRWAAGLHVAGVPDNPNPAKILNMSLGAPGACTSSYRSVVTELTANGVLVVASAGNSGGPVESPANCPNVAAVAGLRHVGTKVGFSSLGREVTVGAPGGNCVNLQGPCLFSLDTTTNTGLTVPQASSYTDQINSNVGTSFSAPFVAGIASLMLSVNGGLTPAQLIRRIRQGARPFPVSADPAVSLCHVPANSGDVQTSECSCTTAACGAGMASAPGSVTAALNPIADISVPGAVNAGQNLVLNANGSMAADGRTISSYAWSTVCGAPVISGASTPVATVMAPESGSFTLRLTVTDDEGAEDFAEVKVTPSAAVTSAPQTLGSTVCSVANGGGGGGGGMGVVDLLLLGAAVSRRRRTRQ